MFYHVLFDTIRSVLFFTIYTYLFTLNFNSVEAPWNGEFYIVGVQFEDDICFRIHRKTAMFLFCDKISDYSSSVMNLKISL